MEKQRRVELMGLSLFAIGLCGILLFFYMAFILFTNFPATGEVTGTDSTQITEDFYTYLIRLMIPILILLIVGGVSILISQYGISTYSQETGKNS
jgi:TRAP-type mannitol/chloroaromatic compound transport system permease small subunit